jgi:hypothetical protein
MVLYLLGAATDGSVIAKPVEPFRDQSIAVLAFLAACPCILSHG